jgi:hypothetical protein
MKSYSTLSFDIMEDVEPDVLSFIKRYVRSFTCWDLLKFLYHNPDTWDTAANLARYTERGAEQVEAEVVQMTQEGLLRRNEQTSEEPVYMLTIDPEILILIEKLVSASRDRTFRMKLVYHILRAGGNK